MIINVEMAGGYVFPPTLSPINKRSNYTLFSFSLHLGNLNLSYKNLMKKTLATFDLSERISDAATSMLRAISESGTPERISYEIGRADGFCNGLCLSNTLTTEQEVTLRKIFVKAIRKRREFLALSLKFNRL